MEDIFDDEIVYNDLDDEWPEYDGNKDLYSDNGVEVYYRQDMNITIATSKYFIRWYFDKSGDISIQNKDKLVSWMQYPGYEKVLDTSIPFDLRLFCIIKPYVRPTPKMQVVWAEAGMINERVEQLLAGQTIDPIAQLGAFT